MQKCSSYSIEYAPVLLPVDLPIEIDDHFQQGDLPIRRLHFHGCLELGLCHSGHGVFVVGSKILPFTAGDVSFIASPEVHLARSAPGTTSSWTWIHLDPAPLALSHAAAAELDASRYVGPGFSNIITAASHPESSRIVERMVAELRVRPVGYRRMLRLLTAELMLTISRMAVSVPQTPKISEAHYQRIGPALSRLTVGATAGTSGTPSLTELASLCGLSPVHFRRLFAETMGRSPREYAVDLKMRFACSLLRGSSNSILSISQETGFRSLSSFNRTFHKTYGMAPRDWRQAGTLEI